VTTVQKRYVVVARARASAVFKQDDFYSLNYKVDNNPPARMIFRTRYVDKKLDHLIPEDLWVQIECSADSIVQAMEAYGNGAREIVGIIGVVANAYMGNVEAHIAFEVTDAVDEREYFQAFLPERPITVVPGRLIDVGAVRSLLGAMVANLEPERDRLMRAIAQYQLALQNWTLGSEVLAVASLFMAVENLKTAALRKHLRDRGVDDAKLAAEWGYKKDGTMKMAPYLDEQARIRLVFHGDADCHREAKWVSDQFEHGLKNFGLLRPRACAALAKTAEHVRDSIIDVSGVVAEAAATLRGNAYSQPRGPLKLVKYLYGKLKGDPKNFAAPGQAYPSFAWKSGLGKVTVDKAGRYGFAPQESMTARFGKGVTFTPTKFEVWDGGVLADRPPPESVGTPRQH
jgi:hypothetical protein